MKILYLISPFIHKLDIKSEQYAENKNSINDCIKTFVEKRENSSFIIENLSMKDSEYLSTKYDLFNIESSAILVIKVGGKIKEDVRLNWNQKDLPIDDIKIKIYNNNIGLITTKILIDSLPLMINEDEDCLDRETNNFSNYLYDILKDYLDKTTDDLGSLINNQSNPSISSTQDTIFTERINSTMIEMSSKTLWTSRTLYISDSEKDRTIQFFKQWSSSDVIDNSQAAFFRQGNNLVTDNYMNEKDLVNSMEFCQYYYSIFYTKNNVLKNISYLIDNNNGEELSHICQEFSILIKDIEINRKESIAGLQGKRRQTVHEIFERWNFYDYIDMVNSRNELLQSKIKTHSERKTQKYRVLLEFILTTVGLISLSDFLLNIYAYISPEYQASKYSIGIFKLLSYLPSEIVISLVVLLTIILSMIFVSRNK